jgi:uncharacterized protein YkwD
VHGPVERPSARPGRHREHGRSVPVLLSVSTVALLAALGAGVALLPDRLTGSGSTAETPAAAIAALAPGSAGGAVSPPAATPPISPRPVAASTPAPSAPGSAAASPAKKPSTTKTSATKTSTTETRTTPSRTPATKTASGLAAQETEVIRLVNVERGKAGCGRVTLNTELRTAIRLHVAELGRHGDLYISHVSDDGRSFVQRAEAQGYDDAGGENVARGQRDAADVMQAWMNSEGHRANILNCSFKAIGVGAARGVDGTIVWGEIFGRS